MIALFAMAALALDAGVWYADHRLAQYQVDAAALAAVQAMADGTPVPTTVATYLEMNGVPAAEVATETTGCSVTGATPVLLRNT